MTAFSIDGYAEQDARDVIALWTGEGGLAAEEAERRLPEVLLVAHDADGDLAAVSSAYLAEDPQLCVALWHVRVFVVDKHRREGVAITLAQRARDALRERAHPGAAGVLFVVQSEILKRHMDRAWWRRTDFTYVGVNARGDHLRVHFFPGAKVPA